MNGQNAITGIDKAQRGLAILLFLSVAVLLGVFCTLGYETLQLKWWYYVIAGLVLIAVGSIIGNWRLYSVCLLVLSIPLHIDFLIYQKWPGDGVIFTAVDGCMVALMFIWLVDLISGKRNRITVEWRMFLPLVAMVLTAIVSIIGSFSKTETVYEVIHCFKLAALFVIMSNSVREKREIRVVVSCLVVSMVVASISLLVSRWFGVRLTAVGIAGGIAEYRSAIRTGGIAGNANSAAQFIAPLLLVCAAFCIGLRGHLVGILAGVVAFLVGLAALVATLSRGGWVSFLCGFLVLCTLAMSKNGIKRVFIAILVIASILPLLAMRSAVKTRLTEYDPEFATVNARITLMKQASLMSSQNLAFGVGAGNYRMVMGDYPLPDEKSFWHWQVHNAYLLKLAECGIGGLLAFLWLLCSFGMCAKRCLNSNEDTTRALGLAGICFLATLCVHMVAEWWDPRAPYALAFVVLLALLAVARPKRPAPGLMPQRSAKGVANHHGENLCATADNRVC